jgi:hypothetical protein
MYSTIIYYKKHIEKNFKNDKYKILHFNHKKYFLLCENCLWMASTIPAIKNISSLRFKKCPICINKVNRFLICDESF